MIGAKPAHRRTPARVSGYQLGLRKARFPPFLFSQRCEATTASTDADHFETFSIT